MRPFHRDHHLPLTVHQYPILLDLGDIHRPHHRLVLDPNGGGGARDNTPGADSSPGASPAVGIGLYLRGGRIRKLIHVCQGSPSSLSATAIFHPPAISRRVGIFNAHKWEVLHDPVRGFHTHPRRKLLARKSLAQRRTTPPTCQRLITLTTWDHEACPSYAPCHRLSGPCYFLHQLSKCLTNRTTYLIRSCAILNN